MGVFEHVEVVASAQERVAEGRRMADALHRLAECELGVVLGGVRGTRRDAKHLIRMDGGTTRSKAPITVAGTRDGEN
jgi:hypothetical protein